MTDAEFEQHLSGLRTTGYREDFQSALCNLYITCEPRHRETLRRDLRSPGVIVRPTAWRYPTAYDRSDLSREQRIRESLICESIFGLGSDDYREELMWLARCYHNLLLMNIDADALLETIAQLSEPSVADFLREWINRRPEDKSLRTWRLEVVQTRDGPIADSHL